MIRIGEEKHGGVDHDIDDADEREADRLAQHIEMRLDQFRGTRATWS